MIREIIKIDQEKCNGCGQCIPGCPEGALQMIDGKARLISDLFCDGLGACIGECPVGAIEIEKREAVPYDEKETMKNIVKQGEATILAHLEHLHEHGEKDFLCQALEFLRENNYDIPAKFEESNLDQETEKIACGCPGSMAREIKRDEPETEEMNTTELRSRLAQWPVQLMLINPHAPYFENSELLIAADCVPFSYANFHEKLLKDKKLLIFCPKLDTTIDVYIEKLTELLKNQNIKSLTIAHMEVPCCFGTVQIVKEALSRSGKEIPINDVTISVNGEIQ